MDATYLCHCSSPGDYWREIVEYSSGVDDVDILAIRTLQSDTTSVSGNMTFIPIQSVAEFHSSITMAKPPSTSSGTKSTAKSVSKRSTEGYVTITWTYELRLGLQLIYEARLTRPNIAKVFKLVFRDYLGACGFENGADIAKRLHTQYHDRRSKDWAMAEQPARDSAEVQRRARLARRIQDAIESLGLQSNVNLPTPRQNVRNNRSTITEWELITPPSTPGNETTPARLVPVVPTRTTSSNIAKPAKERVPYVKGNGSISMMSPAQIAKTMLPIPRVSVSKAHPETSQFTGLLFRFWENKTPRTINSESGFWSRRHYNTLTLSEEAPLAGCIDATDVKNVRP
jgi:hypothetical protein